MAIVARVAVKLHRCSTPWKAGPCWRVQKALDEEGIDYEVVKGPLRPSKRVDLRQLSGQKLYPVIEFENDSTYLKTRRTWPRRSALGISTRRGARPSETA